VNASSSAPPDLIRQGAITALACWFAVVLAFFAHLDNPWWAAISAWVIAHPERHAVLTKGLSRVIGTLVGWLIGCCLTFLVEGAPVMQALVMFLVAATGTYGRYRSEHSYAWTIGAVGALIVLSIRKPASDRSGAPKFFVSPRKDSRRSLQNEISRALMHTPVPKVSKTLLCQLARFGRDCSKAILPSEVRRILPWCRHQNTQYHEWF
jgi:Fusaric acid resistance protein family